MTVQLFPPIIAMMPEKLEQEYIALVSNYGVYYTENTVMRPSSSYTVYTLQDNIQGIVMRESLHLRMEIFWKAVDEWRSVCTAIGEQYVIVAGTAMMPTQFVDNSDTEIVN